MAIATKAFLDKFKELKAPYNEIQIELIGDGAKVTFLQGGVELGYIVLLKGEDLSIGGLNGELEPELQ